MWLIIYLLTISTLLVSCRTPTSSSKLSSDSNDVTHKPWLNYVNETKSKMPLQKSCEPTSFRHKTQERMGVVILMHGFTACPQQFYALANQLSVAGWDVLLPLLPGHGSQDQTHEQKTLPNRETYQSVMPAFVKQMNTIMRQYPSDNKVIGGLSLGSAYATQAVLDDPSIYRRALLIIPYYKLSGLISSILGGLNEISKSRITSWFTPGEQLTKAILERTIGWGQACLEERKGGRAGICDFDITHMIASQQFGYDLSETVRLQVESQFVLVDKDKAVDNDRILRVFHNSEAKRHICFYPDAANHSLASRFDAPTENKFWLEDFERDAIQYITKGIPFRTNGSKIKGFDGCQHGRRI
ncbi:MAG: alpha/beta fold hydrolase [Pseudobacteriovorax sp.]|nr:alpha/beta fold hydrolase [Pseudobacteriovorax sp.]